MNFIQCDHSAPDNSARGCKAAVMRQALAGMLWSKQYYLFRRGDLAQGAWRHPATRQESRKGRNR